jgi:hypothetical protein
MSFDERINGAAFLASTAVSPYQTRLPSFSDNDIFMAESAGESESGRDHPIEPSMVFTDWYYLQTFFVRCFVLRSDLFKGIGNLVPGANIVCPFVGALLALFERKTNIQPIYGTPVFHDHYGF